MLILQAATLIGAVLGLLAVAARHLSRKGILTERMLTEVVRAPVALVLTKAQMGRDLGGQLSRLHSALLFNAPQTPLQVTLVASIDDAATSSKIAQALAENYAQSGDMVLLVCNEGRDSPAPNGVKVETVSLATLQGEGRAQGILDQWGKTHTRIVVDAGRLDAARPALCFASIAGALVCTVTWAQTPRAKMRADLRTLRSLSQAPIFPVLTHTVPRKQKVFARTYGPLSAQT